MSDQTTSRTRKDKILLLRNFDKVFFTYFHYENKLFVKISNIGLNGNENKLFFAFKKFIYEFFDTSQFNSASPEFKFKTNVDTMKDVGIKLADSIKTMYNNFISLNEEQKNDLANLYDSLNDYYDLKLPPIEEKSETNGGKKRRKTNRRKTRRSRSCRRSTTYRRIRRH